MAKKKRIIYHVAIEADGEEDIKEFLSWGQYGVTNAKVWGWKVVGKREDKDVKSG